MKKNFTTNKQQEIHEYQHTQEAEQTKELYNIKPRSKIDRRKMIYHGTPIPGDTQVRNIITYDTKEKLWKCNNNIEVIFLIF